METLKRVFIGIDLPEETKNKIYLLAKSLNIPHMRLIKPENLHLTLRFIGRTTEGQITFLRTGMEQVCKEIKPFTIIFGEVGAFASSKRARVLWLGLSKGREQLETLAQKSENIARKSGFREENRFHPHITFIRFKDPQDVSGFMELANGLFGELANQKMLVDKIVMFESKLKPAGAEYSILHEFLLGQL